jgi:lariat debranching enzyme
MHVSYSAQFSHSVENPEEICISEDEEPVQKKIKMEHTEFYALDKCLPKRDFLKVMDMSPLNDQPLMHDLEWLAIVKVCQPYFSQREHATAFPSAQELDEKVEKERSLLEKSLSQRDLIITKGIFNCMRLMTARIKDD